MGVNRISTVLSLQRAYASRLTECLYSYEKAAAPWLAVSISEYLDHQRFRLAKLAEYGVLLSDDHENGLKYAEGELEDYSSRERQMRPLAALAHLCDVTSARIWFDHPAPADDPWHGAKRASAQRSPDPG